MRQRGRYEPFQSGPQAVWHEAERALYWLDIPTGQPCRSTVHGKLTGFVPIPARKITSVTHGGRAYRTAFVTMAGGNDRGEENEALAGTLLSLDLGVQGKPAFRSQIGV